MTLFGTLFLDYVHLSIGENVSGQWGISRPRYQSHLYLGKFVSRTRLSSGKTLCPQFFRKNLIVFFSGFLSTCMGHTTSFLVLCFQNKRIWHVCLGLTGVWRQSRKERSIISIWCSPFPAIAFQWFSVHSLTLKSSLSFPFPIFL